MHILLIEIPFPDLSKLVLLIADLKGSIAFLTSSYLYNVRYKCDILIDFLLETCAHVLL